MEKRLNYLINCFSIYMPLEVEVDSKLAHRKEMWLKEIRCLESKLLKS